jgi:hypothetical protein
MKTEDLKYRIVEHRSVKSTHIQTVFITQKEYLKNVGWWLFPTYEKEWHNLDYNGDYVWQWGGTAYYQTLELAQEAICAFKSAALPKIHEPKC